MSNYTKATNFTAKDALSSGNPSKIVLGSEIDAELSAVATAITSKVDDVNSLSTDTTIDAADFLLFYDTSASTHKKITRQNAQRPVLQIVHSAQAGASTSGTSYFNLSNSVVGITPLSSSSKILIEVSFSALVGNVAATNAAATFSIYETLTTPLSAEYILDAFSSAGGVGARVPATIRIRINSTGTSLRSFGIQGKVNTGSSIATASNAVWTITEYME